MELAIQAAYGALSAIMKLIGMQITAGSTTGS